MSWFKCTNAFYAEQLFIEIVEQVQNELARLYANYRESAQLPMSFDAFCWWLLVPEAPRNALAPVARNLSEDDHDVWNLIADRHIEEASRAAESR